MSEIILDDDMFNYNCEDGTWYISCEDYECNSKSLEANNKDVRRPLKDKINELNDKINNLREEKDQRIVELEKALAIANLKIKDLKSKLEEANMYVESFGADCKTLQDKLATARKQVCDEIRKEILDYLHCKTMEDLENLSLLDSTSTYDVVTDKLEQIVKGDKE